MERKAFQDLQNIESSWWYQAREAVVSRILRKYYRVQQGVILDIGAGYGGMCASLKSFGAVDALEPDNIARETSEERGYRKILDITEAKNLPHNAYQLIAILDVLEHVLDDETFLKTLFAVLATNGEIIITVPAFQFLWSTHDVLHHHHRRYTKKSLREVLEKCGFQVEFISYWNMLLFFPAALVRMLGSTGQSSLSMPTPLNAIIEFIVKTESRLLPTFSLPLGTGLVAYAKKIDQHE